MKFIIVLVALTACGVLAAEQDLGDGRVHTLPGWCRSLGHRRMAGQQTYFTGNNVTMASCIAMCNEAGAACHQAVFELSGPWGPQCWLGTQRSTVRPRGSRPCRRTGGPCVDFCYNKEGYARIASDPPASRLIITRVDNMAATVGWNAPPGQYFYPSGLHAPSDIMASSGYMLKQCRNGHEVWRGAIRLWHNAGRRMDLSSSAAGQFEVGDMIVLPSTSCSTSSANELNLLAEAQEVSDVENELLGELDTDTDTDTTDVDDVEEEQSLSLWPYVVHSGRDCIGGAFKCGDGSLHTAYRACEEEAKCGAVAFRGNHYCLKHPVTHCRQDYRNGYKMYKKPHCPNYRMMAPRRVDCKHGAYKCGASYSECDAKRKCAGDRRCGGVSVSPNGKHYCLKHKKRHCSKDYGNKYTFFTK